MKLSKNHCKILLESLSLTRENELDCGECQSVLAEFLEHKLENKSLNQSLELVRAHLELCAECREEFEALEVALDELAAQ